MVLPVDTLTTERDCYHLLGWSWPISREPVPTLIQRPVWSPYVLPWEDIHTDLEGPDLALNLWMQTRTGNALYGVRAAAWAEYMLRTDDPHWPGYSVMGTYTYIDPRTGIPSLRQTALQEDVGQSNGCHLFGAEACVEWYKATADPKALTVAKALGEIGRTIDYRYPMLQVNHWPGAGRGVARRLQGAVCLASLDPDPKWQQHAERQVGQLLTTPSWREALGCWAWDGQNPQTGEKWIETPPAYHIALVIRALWTYQAQSWATQGDAVRARITRVAKFALDHAYATEPRQACKTFRQYSTGPLAGPIRCWGDRNEMTPANWAVLPQSTLAWIGVSAFGYALTNDPAYLRNAWTGWCGTKALPYSGPGATDPRLFAPTPIYQFTDYETPFFVDARCDGAEFAHNGDLYYVSPYLFGLTLQAEAAGQDWRPR